MRRFTVAAIVIGTLGTCATAAGSAQAAAGASPVTARPAAPSPVSVSTTETTAQARVRMTVRPRVVRAGRYIRVTLRCPRPPRRGFIDGPTSFGQVYLRGHRTIRVRVPSSTPRGRHRVNGYCTSRSTPHGWTYFRVTRRR
ncbi:MAG TPA: hypothetical protein VHJ17_05105 [Thermomonospora sp.]|nr:hypothetical protein [Thermomonospora sp.]